MRECEATFLGPPASLHQLEDGRREGSQRPCRYPGARLAGEGRVHAEGGEGAPDNSARTARAPEVRWAGERRGAEVWVRPP